MKDSSMTTELEDILMTIDESDADLSFFMGVMKDLNLELSEYTPEEAALIRKSQVESVSESESFELERILKNSQDELDNQEDMVKSYLAQCNRGIGTPKLMLH